MVTQNWGCRHLAFINTRVASLGKIAILQFQKTKFFVVLYIWGLDVIHRKFVIWSLTYLDILLHSGCEQNRFYSAHVSVLFSLKASSFKRAFLNNVKNVAICPWLSWLKWNWHWLFEIVRWAEERGWHSPELIYNFQDLQILTFDQNWNRPRKLELSFSTLNVLNSAYIF